MDYFFKNMVRKRYGYGTIRKTGRTATDPTRIPKFWSNGNGIALVYGQNTGDGMG